MPKIEAFKTSTGELMENERDYILAEAKNQRKAILKQWGHFSDMINDKPEFYYQLIKYIGTKIIDDKTTKEELDEQLEKVVSIFNKEQEIKLTENSGEGIEIEMEPYLWGNDILPGHDFKR